MSIVKLKKLSIIGMEKEKRRIIRQLQTFGQLHIIEKRDKDKLAQANNTANADRRAQQAIRFLLQSANKRQPISQSNRFRMDELVDEVLLLQENIRLATDQLDEVKDRIQRMKPWGDFDFPPEDSLRELRFWFYILPLKCKSKLSKLTLPWQVVGQSTAALYVIVVDAEEPAMDFLPVQREHLGSRSLKQLQSELERVTSELEEYHAQRQRLTRYLYLMRKHQVRADNHARFEHVLAQADKNHDTLFSLQAWLPVTESSALDQLAKQEGFAYQLTDPEDHEMPPTLLRPKHSFKPGSLLAKVYQLPAYRSWDPSAHLYLSFALFFAMILSDAGYALLLLLVLSLGWKKLARNETGLNMAKLMRLLFFTALGWGVLAGSYFGYAPSHLILQQLNIVKLDDYDAMMKLSVCIGISHIILANATLAWSRRQQLRFVLSRVGWIFTVLAGGMLWLFDQSYIGQIIAPFLGVAGLSLVFLFTSERKIENKKHGLLFLLDGLMSLTGLSKLFGDVLSYMRLFALGLASASLALTFNGLAADAFAQGQGVGVLAGALIFVLGHSVNLALGIMSGVVHGLRLNFIEFYNWGEPGEGYAYDHFKIKEIEHE